MENVKAPGPANVIQTKRCKYCDKELGSGARAFCNSVHSRAWFKQTTEKGRMHLPSITNVDYDIPGAQFMFLPRGEKL